MILLKIRSFDQKLLPRSQVFLPLEMVLGLLRALGWVLELDQVLAQEMFLVQAQVQAPFPPQVKGQVLNRQAPQCK